MLDFAKITPVDRFTIRLGSDVIPVPIGFFAGQVSMVDGREVTKKIVLSGHDIISGKRFLDKEEDVFIHQKMMDRKYNLSETWLLIQTNSWDDVAPSSSNWKIAYPKQLTCTYNRYMVRHSDLIQLSGKV